MGINDYENDCEAVSQWYDKLPIHKIVEDFDFPIKKIDDIYFICRADNGKWFPLQQTYTRDSIYPGDKIPRVWSILECVVYGEMEYINEKRSTNRTSTLGGSNR